MSTFQHVQIEDARHVLTWLFAMSAASVVIGIRVCVKRWRA